LNQGYQLRDRRTLKIPERYSKEDFYSLIAEFGKPTSYEEAITGREASNWIKAMNEEIDSLKKNTTWTLVDSPTNCSIIDNRWTYKIKQNGDGSVQHFKARLVAKGFKQQAGIDYYETFSPAARLTQFELFYQLLPQET